MGQPRAFTTDVSLKTLYEPFVNNCRKYKETNAAPGTIKIESFPSEHMRACQFGNGSGNTEKTCLIKEHIGCDPKPNELPRVQVYCRNEEQMLAGQNLVK